MSHSEASGTDTSDTESVASATVAEPAVASRICAHSDTRGPRPIEQSVAAVLSARAPRPRRTCAACRSGPLPRAATAAQRSATAVTVLTGATATRKPHDHDGPVLGPDPEPRRSDHQRRRCRKSAAGRAARPPSGRASRADLVRLGAGALGTGGASAHRSDADRRRPMVPRRCVSARGCRRRRRGDRHAADSPTSVLDCALRALGLTGRECEVAARVLRGDSAKTVAPHW
jgi:hypothetical protein